MDDRQQAERPLRAASWHLAQVEAAVAALVDAVRDRARIDAEAELAAVTAERNRLQEALLDILDATTGWTGRDLSLEERLSFIDTRASGILAAVRPGEQGEKQ